MAENSTDSAMPAWILESRERQPLTRKEKEAARKALIKLVGKKKVKALLGKPKKKQ